MVWIILSIIAALGDATVYAVMKKLKDLTPVVIIWTRFTFALPFLLLSLFLFPFSKPPSLFYPVLIINAIGIALAFSLIYKATQRSELSKSIPLLNITPIFLILTSYIILGELPSFTGLIGIGLIVSGAFLIHIKKL